MHKCDVYYDGGIGGVSLASFIEDSFHGNVRINVRMTSTLNYVIDVLN